MNDDAEKDILRVVAMQGDRLKNSLETNNKAALAADRAISEAEALFGKLGLPLPERNRSDSAPSANRPPRLRSWQEIVDEARDEHPGEISFADIISEAEAATSRGQIVTLGRGIPRDPRTYPLQLCRRRCRGTARGSR